MNSSKKPRTSVYNIGLDPRQHGRQVDAIREREAMIAYMVAMDATLSDAIDLESLRAKRIQLRSDCMDWWLWKTDPAEGCSLECFLNLNHLIGLVIVRHMGLTSDTQGDMIHGGIVHDIPVSKYSLRNLVDAVQFLQYEWHKKGFVLHQHARAYLKACMRRFGLLVMTGGPRDVMDHEAFVDEIPCACDTISSRISLSAIRRFLCIFLCMERHIYVSEKSAPLPSIPDGEGVMTRVLPHHVFGAEDGYIDMSYHRDLMIGAKLTYLHDFSSMYHTVSQVLYFHNPDYKLPAREVRVDQINRGVDEEGIPLYAPNVFPPFLQMYPGLEIKYEESLLDITRRRKGYSLLLFGCDTYLLTPTGELYVHENLIKLMEYYVYHEGGAAG